MYYIYLILSEIDNITQWKIGITRNLNQRLNNLKTGNPNITGIHAFYEITDREIAYKTEALIKKFLKEYKVNGEWFMFESLNKDIFFHLCDKYENSIKIWKNIQNNIKEDKKYKNW